MSELGVRIPSRIEAVIVRALAKTPDERPRTAREFRDALTEAFRASIGPWTGRRAVVGALATLLVGVGVGVAVQVGRRRDTASDLDPRRVVVADFDNETADSAYARWGDVAGEIIATRLAQVAGLHVVTSQRWLARSQQLQRQVNAGDLLRTLAAETKAATVVTGGYYRNKNKIDLILEVTDARTGVLMRTLGPVSVSPSSPDSSVLSLGVKLGAALDSILVQHSAATEAR